MEKIIFTAGILLLPAVCTTVGAAGAFLFRRAQEPRTQRMTSGMAAGIMLAASVWSLLLPAIERAERGVWPGWFPPTAGLVVGAVGLLRLEALAGRWFAAGPGHCGHMVLAVTLHNLALGIGLQNIPEGAAVSLPLLRSGQSRGRAFLAGAASGLVEPLGGLLALAVAGWVSAALPWLMSAAAGCMVCVTAQEMIPQAVEPDESAGVISIVLGFALMMALDVAL